MNAQALCDALRASRGFAHKRDISDVMQRLQPVLPAGSIELQTHGSEVRFRSIYVREIPEAEGKKLLASVEVGAR